MSSEAAGGVLDPPSHRVSSSAGQHGSSKYSCSLCWPQQVKLGGCTALVMVTTATVSQKASSRMQQQHPHRHQQLLHQKGRKGLRCHRTRCTSLPPAAGAGTAGIHAAPKPSKTAAAVAAAPNLGPLAAQAANPEAAPAAGTPSCSCHCSNKCSSCCHG